MDREQAQRWLQEDLIGTQRAEQARLHVGNPDPDTAESIRSHLVAQLDTIESVTKDIANGLYGA